MPKILGMEPKTAYWVLGGGGVALLLLLYLRSRAGAAAGQSDSGDNGAVSSGPTFGPEYIPAGSDLNAPLNAANAANQAETATVASAMRTLYNNPVMSGLATIEGGQRVSVSDTGEITSPYLISGQAGVTRYQPSTRPDWCSGFGYTWHEDTHQCTNIAGVVNPPGSQPQAVPAQPDSHAPPPGTQCPPGQHWSYNQRRCRNDVNWLGAAINAAASIFTGGATAPAAASSAANNLGFDPGMTGGSGSTGGSGQTDALGGAIVQSATRKQMSAPSRASRRPALSRNPYQQHNEVTAL